MPPLPNELWWPILSELCRPDLKACRLTCKQLSELAAVPLFRVFYTSCLQIEQLVAIACHPRLANLVEELCFAEISFDRPSADDHVDFSREKLISWMVEFNEQSEPDKMQTFYPVRFPSSPFLSLAELQTLISLQPAVSELLADIESQYHTQAMWQRSEVCCAKVKEALGGLKRLEKIVFFDARDNGIHVDIPFMPPALKTLQQLFPISEGIYNGFFTKSIQPYNYDGFIAVLQAAADLGKRGLDIVVEGKQGPFRNGIDFLNDLSPRMVINGLGHFVDGFRFLRSLKLCLDCTDFINPPDETVQSKINSSLVVEGLSVAKDLFQLEIIITGQMGSEAIFTNNKYPGLKILRLENFSFASEWLTEFLINLPCLRSLFLSYIDLQGFWDEMVDAWAEKEDFILDEVEISHPHGWELDRSGQIVRCGWQVDCVVASRVSNADLLAFINGGGKSNNQGSSLPKMTNPFTNRKFVDFNHARPFWSTRFPDERDLNIARNIVPYDGENRDDFSDMSGWSVTDYPPGLYPELDDETDPDGPEFDEDYDFDAEVSSSDDDDEDEDGVDMETESD